MFKTRVCQIEICEVWPESHVARYVIVYLTGTRTRQCDDCFIALRAELLMMCIKLHNLSINHRLTHI